MNDNKSTVMNNAAVQQLRKVPGFDPMKLLRKTISIKTGHPVWKLDLRYKRLWFRLACPNGRMLLKPLRCDVTRSVSKMTEIERRGGKRWDKPKKAEKSRDCGGGKF